MLTIFCTTKPSNDSSMQYACKIARSFLKKKEKNISCFILQATANHQCLIWSFNSKQKQILPNISMKQVAQTTHTALGKKGDFRHHFTQISRNGGNAEWCVTTSCHEDIIIHSSGSKETRAICMCCIFNLMCCSWGSSTHLQIYLLKSNVSKLIRHC